jgi:hypothetical protein
MENRLYAPDILRDKTLQLVSVDACQCWGTSLSHPLKSPGRVVSLTLSLPFEENPVVVFAGCDKNNLGPKLCANGKPCPIMQRFAESKKNEILPD